MIARGPHILTMPDGSRWPVPQSTNTLSTGTSWKLRYKNAADLSPTDLGHAADVIDAYSRLCAIPPSERDKIINALRDDLANDSEGKTA